MRSFTPVWMIKTTMLLLCLHSASSLFHSISFPTDESVQRQLLSSQQLPSIPFSVEGDTETRKPSSQHIQQENSFRQPRVLHIDPKFCTIIQKEGEDKSKHEIHIAKTSSKSKKEPGE
mmetsp:Transcript_29161/g.70396  ORF Transcript_29161/g.70396 Transcript_29161/m.70396 type:complete len:118 (+) Transcript_29161:84-437(+)